jgi:hypothetical protein
MLIVFVSPKMMLKEILGFAALRVARLRRQRTGTWSWDV